MKLNSIILLFVASAIAAPLTTIDDKLFTRDTAGDIAECRGYCGDKARALRDDCLKGLQDCVGSQCAGFRQNCLTKGEKFFLSCEKGCYAPAQTKAEGAVPEGSSTLVTRDAAGDIAECRGYCGDKARALRDDCLKGLQDCVGSQCAGFRQNCLTKGEKFFLSCEKGCYSPAQTEAEEAVY